ncbi:hypothetical protein GCM10009527_073550 [Actinomadura nitritigenes]|uniref:Transposase n=1 Tax=Actinomadura nitritigenes TaxID=134602 RepID=A0ABS3RF61_9ACTN|nr:transposase [Actinomadura nitritigenes]
MLSDAAGLPLVVGLSAANTAGIEAFKPLFMALPLIRSRRGPRRRRPDKARADKGYDSAELRAWLRRRGVTPRIAPHPRRHAHLLEEACHVTLLRRKASSCSAKPGAAATK